MHNIQNWVVIKGNANVFQETAISPEKHVKYHLSYVTLLCIKFLKFGDPYMITSSKENFFPTIEVKQDIRY